MMNIFMTDSKIHTAVQNCDFDKVVHLLCNFAASSLGSDPDSIDDVIDDKAKLFITNVLTRNAKAQAQRAKHLISQWSYESVIANGAYSGWCRSKAQEVYDFLNSWRGVPFNWYAMSQEKLDVVKEICDLSQDGFIKSMSVYLDNYYHALVDTKKVLSDEKLFPYVINHWLSDSTVLVDKLFEKLVQYMGYCCKTILFETDKNGCEWAGVATGTSFNRMIEVAISLQRIGDLQTPVSEYKLNFLKKTLEEMKRLSKRKNPQPDDPEYSEKFTEVLDEIEQVCLSNDIDYNSLLSTTVAL